MRAAGPLLGSHSLGGQLLLGSRSLPGAGAGTRAPRARPGHKPCRARAADRLPPLPSPPTPPAALRAPRSRRSAAARAALSAAANPALACRSRACWRPSSPGPCERSSRRLGGRRKQQPQPGGLAGGEPRAARARAGQWAGTDGSPLPCQRTHLLTVANLAMHACVPDPAHLSASLTTARH
jgi:hypothetical protein